MYNKHRVYPLELQQATQPARRPSHGKKLLISISIVATTLLYLLAIILLLISSIIIPMLPRISVTSATLTTHNVSTNQVFANWGIEFSIEVVPQDVKFSHVEALLPIHHNNDTSVVSTSIEPFRVGNSLEKVWARFEPAWVPIEGWIMHENDGSGLISETDLNVELHAKADFEFSLRESLRVECKDVKVGFTSNSNETILVSSWGSSACNVSGYMKHKVDTLMSGCLMFLFLFPVVGGVIFLAFLSLCKKDTI